jgi:hypothetical protein
MTRRTLAALAALLLASAFASGGAAAQDAPSTDDIRRAHERVMGCYRLEPSADAPWLHEVDQSFRLTLDPAPGAGSDPGGAPQYLVREATGARVQPTRWTWLAWSLFGDGDIVSIVWSSGQDQVALTFVPDPSRPNVVSLGSTTFFEHEKQKLSDPVDVRVTAILC